MHFKRLSQISIGAGVRTLGIIGGRSQHGKLNNRNVRLPSEKMVSMVNAIRFGRAILVATMLKGR
ncbi:hypothetical protein [Sphingobacterium hotanense]|uniref:hypothetical protein n=1 Tax=Sphingobacterium hotanense TaxID=649196 RepID=UPI0021A5EEAE|nr:hypothetical protein [Sphingobacterium hotanense]MCT1523809.1 hypothetical protein [Sphingobacterium hotanense]